MKHRLNDMVFIHYGSNAFDIEHFYDITNTDNTKPPFGLWGCPDSPFYLTLKNIQSYKKCGLWMWANNLYFCLASLAVHKYSFLNRGYFKFMLSKNAKILIVQNEEEIRQYCITTKRNYKIERDTIFIDFDRIRKKYDGMFVYHPHAGNELQNTILRNWETDSIVVWNLNVIKILQGA